MKGKKMKITKFLSGPLSVNCYVVSDEATKKSFIVDPGGHNKDMVNYIKENDLGFMQKRISKGKARCMYT